MLFFLFSHNPGFTYIYLVFYTTPTTFVSVIHIVRKPVDTVDQGSVLYRANQWQAIFPPEVRLRLELWPQVGGECVANAPPWALISGVIVWVYEVSIL